MDDGGQDLVVVGTVTQLRGQVHRAAHADAGCPAVPEGLSNDHSAPWETEQVASALGGERGDPRVDRGQAPRYPVQRFDQLLRPLVTWELVTLEQLDGEEVWQLSADAQRRVAELARSRAQPPEDVVHLGGRCEECHSRRSLRLSGGRLLCDECRTSDGQQKSRST
jgi:hypothetical protein